MRITRSNRALFRRLLIRFILAVFIVLFFVYGLPVVFQLFYPFIFALILAAAANPLVNLINGQLKRLNIKSSTSRNIVTFFLTAFVLILLVSIFYFIISALLNEIFVLSKTIQENWSSIVLLFEQTERWLTDQMAILPAEAMQILEGILGNILEFIQNASRNLPNYTVTFTGLFISKAGSVTLNAVTFFLAFYFLMSDFERIKNFVRKRTDQRLLRTGDLLKNTIIIGVWGYVKTQLILAVLAFVVMFLSFSLYGIDYALTIAIFLAVIDMIPLIGTIAVLAPWGLFELFLGDPNFGLFLLLLGIGFFILRRLTEPKVMGTQTGLHPLLALVGIYVGIQFSGLWGALFGPLVMVVLIGFLHSGILDNTFADIRELYHQIALSLRREKPV